MPLTVPSGILTKANWVLLYLKPLVDAVEAEADTAASTAATALTTAQARYAKPAQGIGPGDLATTVYVGLRYTFLWNGTAYVGPTGTVATSSNRTANTYRDFIGPSDPNALGLMVNGDAWDSA